MKKIDAKKTVTIIVVILVIGILIPVFFGYKTRHNAKDLFNSLDDGLQRIYSNIFSISTVYLASDDTFSDLLENNKTAIEELKESKPYFYYFISGIQNCTDEKYDLAYDDFEKCVSYYDKNVKYERRVANIFGRAYYEMAFIEHKRGNFNEYKNYIATMEELLLANESYIVLVDMLTWACQESYKSENGIELSIVYAEKMLEYAKKCDYPEMGYVYIVASNAYGTNDDDVRFINYMMQALDEYSNVVDEEGNISTDEYEVAYCLINIGNQYLNDENYEEAQNYLLQAFEMDLEDYDIETQAEVKVYAAQNLCYLQIKKGDLKMAKEYLDFTAEWISKENVEVYRVDKVAFILTNAEYQIAVGNYDKAIELLNDCLKQYNDNSNFSYINFDCDIYNDLAEAYYEKGEYKTALDYYLKLENIITYRGMDSESERYLRGLFLTYLSLNEDEKALVYAEKYLNLLKEKIQSSQFMQGAYLEYINKEQENQITVLSNRNHWMRRMIIVAILVIGIIFTLGAVTITQSRKLKKLMLELKEISEIDELTKINNRRSMDSFLQNKWDSIRLTDQSVCVAMADIDYFKKFNDTYGHQKGDEVLTQVANAFKLVCARDQSFIARYGGEEFILVLWNVTSNQAIEKVERIRRTVEALMIEHKSSDVSNVVTISIGCLLIDENSEDLDYEKAISLADKALYKAKEEKNKVEVY